MIIQTRRYGFVKTMVFSNTAINVITPGLLFSINYRFTFKGILNMPFFLMGFYYCPRIHDFVPGPVKMWNYADPLLGITANFTSTNADKLIGDDINHSISVGTWIRAEIAFKPGIHYDLSNSPLRVSDQEFDIVCECLIDNAYVPAGTIHLYDAFFITLGCDMPIEMAGGEIIPPPVIELPLP